MKCIWGFHIQLYMHMQRFQDWSFISKKHNYLQPLSIQHYLQQKYITIYTTYIFFPSLHPIRKEKKYSTEWKATKFQVHAQWFYISFPIWEDLLIVVWHQNLQKLSSKDLLWQTLLPWRHLNLLKVRIFNFFKPLLTCVTIKNFATSVTMHTNFILTCNSGALYKDALLTF